MKISVALCSYNGAKYIKEQLDSILSQTSNIEEIIICDDISTDGTWEILKNYQNNFSEKIKIFQNTERLGVMFNFQQALMKCTGDIILLSDQDDIWLTNKAEFFDSYFIENKGIDLLFSNAEIFDETAKITHLSLFDLLNFNTKTQAAFNCGFGLEMSELLGRVSGFTIGVRKSFVQKCLPFLKDYEYFIHDKQLVLCAIQKGTIAFTSECLTKYRIHPEQTSDLYNYLINHNYLNNENLLFRFAPIREDDISFLKQKGFKNKRFDFSDKRRRIIKSPLGLFLISLNFILYKKYYKQYACKAMFFDIESFFKLNKIRITHLFSKKE